MYLRVRIRCGQRDGSVPGGNRERKYIREPSDSTRCCTNRFKPWIIAAIEITEETPITIPMTVNAERAFAERSVSKAARKFSRTCGVVRTAIIQTSGRQWDPVETREMPDRFRRTDRPPNLTPCP